MGRAGCVVAVTEPGRAGCDDHEVRTSPVTWTRDGRSLLIVRRDSAVRASGCSSTRRTGKGARVVSPYEGIGSGGTWSSGHRFFAIEALDGARRQTLLLLDGTLRHPVAALRYGQPLAWAPHGQLLAFLDPYEHPDLRRVGAARDRHDPGPRAVRLLG